MCCAADGRRPLATGAGKPSPGSLEGSPARRPKHSMVSSVNVPDDLRYTADHEWARLEGERVRVGITDYAQDALGDIVYVQLPGPGTPTVAGQPLCELESTKSVSDVYAPLDGTVVEVNSELVDAPRARQRGSLRRRVDLRDRAVLSRGLRGPARRPTITGSFSRLDVLYCNRCGHRNPRGPTSAPLAERRWSAAGGGGRPATNTTATPAVVLFPGRGRLGAFPARAERPPPRRTARAAPSSW